MKYLELFEAKKKTEDPFYHLAVAIRDYLAENIDVRYDPKIKYYYSTIRICGNEKFDGVHLCEINTYHGREKDVFSLRIVNLEGVAKRGEPYTRFGEVEDNMKKEILKVLKKFPIKEFYDIYKFPKSIVYEMTEEFEKLVAAKKYNL